MLHALGGDSASASIYSMFIKEKLSEIKAGNPAITHPEAFKIASALVSWTRLCAFASCIRASSVDTYIHAHKGISRWV